MFYKNRRTIKRKKIFVGIIILLVLILFGGVLLMRSRLGEEAEKNVYGLSGCKEKTESFIKIACVGDSITYGYGLSQWSKNNYPTILNELLGECYQVGNFGDSGSCVQPFADQPYIETEAHKQSIDYEAEILIFMMGTNDSKFENWKNIETFRKHYLELLEGYLGEGNEVQVYLCTLAKVYYTDGKTSGLANFEVQPELVDEINVCIRQLAEEREYSLIDINTLTAAHPEWFVEDGVHPNADGAKAIAEEVWKEISKKCVGGE